MGGRRRDAGAIPAGPGSIQHVDDMGEAPRHSLARAESQRSGPTVEGYPVQAGSTPDSSMSPIASLSRAGRRISVIPANGNPGVARQGREALTHLLEKPCGEWE